MLYSAAKLRVSALPGDPLTIDDELNALDDNVRRLKIEFDVFFGGGSKKPPNDLEWRVQSLIKKYSDARKLNFGQRFKLNTITQRYAIYNSLWQQKLRIKEEGYRRPQDALLAIQGVRQFEDGAPEALDLSESESFRTAFADPEKEAEKVRALYEAMLEARKANNIGGNAGSFDSFRQFVKKKTSQLQQEYGTQAVEYSIEAEGGQVRLKAQPRSAEDQPRSPEATKPRS